MILYLFWFRLLSTQTLSDFTFAGSLALSQNARIQLEKNGANIVKVERSFLLAEPKLRQSLSKVFILKKKNLQKENSCSRKANFERFIIFILSPLLFLASSFYWGFCFCFCFFLAVSGLLKSRFFWPTDNESKSELCVHSFILLWTFETT